MSYADMLKLKNVLYSTNCKNTVCLAELQVLCFFHKLEIFNRHLKSFWIFKLFSNNGARLIIPLAWLYFRPFKQVCKTFTRGDLGKIKLILYNFYYVIGEKYRKLLKWFFLRYVDFFLFFITYAYLYSEFNYSFDAN